MTPTQETQRLHGGRVRGESGPTSASVDAWRRHHKMIYVTPYVMEVFLSKTSPGFAVNCNQSRQASCFLVMGDVGLKSGCRAEGFLLWWPCLTTEAEHQCGCALRAARDLMMTWRSHSPAQTVPMLLATAWPQWQRQMSAWSSPILVVISPHHCITERRLSLEIRSLNSAHTWLCDLGPVTHPLWASVFWLDYISSSQSPCCTHGLWCVISQCHLQRFQT